jgi:predicted nuclease of predicted toxin-antitoxin system
MKILIDMNLSPTWVSFFEKHDIVAYHWSTIGKSNDLDVIIFDYARQNNFVVFTNDLDFGAILATTNANFPSVFQLKSQELLPQIIGDSVLACLLNYESYLREGSLITFDTLKIRIRILPLK